MPQSPKIELKAAVESEQQWIENMESSDSSEEADFRKSEGVTMKLEYVGKEVNSGPRRSTRSTARKFLSKRFIEEVFCSIISGSSASSYCSQLMHLAKGNTDVNTREVHISDPRVYSVKRSDPDMPSFNEAVGEFSEKYIEAMKKEVSALILQNTWITVPWSEADNVIMSTCAFKLKQLPDGTPSKFNARFFVRGDLQKEGIDYFETYSPVVAWSTIRTLLTLVLQEGWITRQVDYDNAFAQAELSETVFVEPSKLFGPKLGKDLVLKLLKSLWTQASSKKLLQKTKNWTIGMWI